MECRGLHSLQFVTANSPINCNLSLTSFRALKDEFNLTPSPKSRVKGKALPSPINVYEYHHAKKKRSLCVYITTFFANIKQ